jgi:FkbM family methyltransferase
MLITYGKGSTLIDVTEICKLRLQSNNCIVIPASDDTRAVYFGDPLPHVLKSIFITDANGTTEYDNTYVVYIDLSSNKVRTEFSVDARLDKIHKTLKIKHGLFSEEVPEQKMVTRYLKGNEKVLEIGGNIGRNSLVIGSIVGSNLVVLETDPDIYAQLKENRNLNNMTFHIENSALSKRRLIQREWDTMPSDTVLPGYKEVQSISYDGLLAKYNVQFDTLVLDCEGAFYYILQDMPEILDSIKLIIMENDYYNVDHKYFVDNVLKTRGFCIDYSEGGGWGACRDYFFQVWKRD